VPSISSTLLDKLRQPESAKDAWVRFVELFTPLLYHFAQRVEPHDAADLVQEVFVALVKCLPEFRYEPGKSFKAWLWTITRHKWVELHRRRKSVEVLSNAALDDLADKTGADWNAEYRMELICRAMELIQGDFEPKTWQAYRQVAVLGRPMAEVAEELSMSVGAVRVAKFRVIHRLQQELQGFLD
jgi:RNA polymerase sigma-70 factor, ECF subfamily